MLSVDHLFTYTNPSVCTKGLPGPRRAVRTCRLPPRTSSLCKGPGAGQSAVGKIREGGKGLKRRREAGVGWLG